MYPNPLSAYSKTVDAGDHMSATDSSGTITILPLADFGKVASAITGGENFAVTRKHV
jgi:hypothetical protein